MRNSLDVLRRLIPVMLAVAPLVLVFTRSRDFGENRAFRAATSIVTAVVSGALLICMVAALLTLASGRPL